MRNAPVQITRLIALSLSLNLLGCSSPSPSPPAPEAPRPMTPEGGIVPPMQAPSMTAPSMAAPTSPTNLGSGAMAAPLPGDSIPPAAATATPPQAPGPIQPNQSPVDFSQLQAGIPGQIPAESAAGQLFPLNASQLANVQYPATPFAGTTGYSYGAIPNMLNYGVYNNCLYYPYQGALVPYTLQGNYYYPYVYSSAISPYWSGYCAYPFLVLTNGYYYPYFYYTNDYLFGFPDWEYNWPVFRSRHHNYDWDRLNSHRRSGTGDFSNWRDRSSRRNRQGSAATGDRSSRWNRQNSAATGDRFQPRGNRLRPADAIPEVTSPEADPRANDGRVEHRGLRDAHEGMRFPTPEAQPMIIERRAAGAPSRWSRDRDNAGESLAPEADRERRGSRRDRHRERQED